MLHLLYGPEDFLKKQYLKQLAAKTGSQLEYLNDIERERLKQLVEPALFGGSKIFVLEDKLGDITPEMLELMKSASQTFTLLEIKLDKRKKETKTLLADKKILSQEFTTPTGADLRKFLTDQIKDHKGQFTPRGLETLLGVLEESTGDYSGPQWNLWAVDNELRKLATYAAGQPIDEHMVGELLSLQYQPEVWSIINAVAEKDRTKALQAIEKFLAETEGADDRTKIIQLNALLADQARSLLMVKDFVDRRVGDTEILKKTSWKSGRLFVLKRLAGRFTSASLRDTLAKLAALDREVKSSGLPARVLLDLIVAQMG